jgi:cytoskeletal protein RodZ
VESLGNKLKTAREGKGYTFDQVSRETNIAGRYIEALEGEDFSIFPGEPYLLGFLRNYSEYLGLDPQELLFLYRSLKIQEQPVPVEQLLRPPSAAPRIIRGALILAAVLAAAGGAAYFFLLRPRTQVSAEPEVRPAAEYVLDGQLLERRFYRGDSILIPLVDDQYKMELANLGEAVTIATPGGQVILDLSQETQLDLNRDSLGDLRITLMDFVKNDPAQGALVRFEMVSSPLPFEEAPAFPAEPDGAGGEAGSAPAAGPSPGISAAPVVFTSPNAYPFTLQASFQGYCMFRWEILGERDRRDRNEQYFQRADELNIQAQNGIRMWISNAAAVKLQVIGGGRTVPLEVGGTGEVVVADVRWVRDDEGRYRLVLARLD